MITNRYYGLVSSCRGW